jgi:flavin reductase (DIM6/NTAB) family NADH-FMN oxidoreductase RutF
MTIHDSHPFLDPDPDPVRRLRGRLGGAVSLWTTGEGPARAGLTVSSLLVANGEPARLLALVDPDSDLAESLAPGGRAAVTLLAWEHRDLAEAFAGTAPAPGGPFRQATFEQTPWGPVPAGPRTWAGVVLEDVREVGWSSLLTTRIEQVTIGDDDRPLVHRRGRYVRPTP